MPDSSTTVHYTLLFVDNVVQHNGSKPVVPKDGDAMSSPIAAQTP